MGKIERFYVCLVQQKTLQALQGSAIKKFLTFHSVHFHPAQFTRPSSPIFRGSGSETKWEQYHNCYSGAKGFSGANQVTNQVVPTIVSSPDPTLSWGETVW